MQDVFLQPQTFTLFWRQALNETPSTPLHVGGGVGDSADVVVAAVVVVIVVAFVVAVAFFQIFGPFFITFH